MRKKITTSKYNFKSLIEENCIYVDKTEELYKLISKPDGQFFMSRPRRFGKSLTLSTLESIFSGEKELFKDLYIHDKKDIDWKSFPIIKLSLNSMSSSTVEELDVKLSHELEDIAEDYNLKVTRDGATEKFKELIKKLNKKNNKVVLLIDDFDKPILDNILVTEEVEKIKIFLKKFYGIIRAMNEFLRFTFITGISNISQILMQDELNSLDDISFDPNYATICGITQEECESYFDEWLVENSIYLKLSKKEYLEKLKIMYRGFKFTEKDIELYNPVSLIKTMKQKKIQSHWFYIATPSFLIELLKVKEYDILDITKVELNPHVLSNYYTDKVIIEHFFLQTGYLTIKKYDSKSNFYILHCPNEEVKYAFKKYLLDFFKAILEIDKSHSDKIVLNLSDIEKEIRKIQSLLASVENKDVNSKISSNSNSNSNSSDNNSNKYYESAEKLVVEHQMASVSMLQRAFSIGYARAGKIIDELERNGVIGSHNGSMARIVLKKNGNSKVTDENNIKEGSHNESNKYSIFKNKNR